jgi:DNA-binding IclR family transcriptional regulator
VLARPVKRYTELTMTGPAQIRAALAETRARGYAVSDRQVTMDALSVAVPIHDARGGVAAALSLVVHHGSALPQSLVPLLHTSARAISRASAT